MAKDTPPKQGSGFKNSNLAHGTYCYYGKVITTPVADIGNVKKSNASNKKG